MIAALDSSHWVRCADKMPPENTYVLAYQVATGRIGIGRWMQRDDGKMWTFDNKTMHDSLHSNKNLSPTEFSHWMPLPEAP